MTADRPVLGILLMLAFCLIAPLADAMAKILGQRFPIMELVVVRFLLQFVVLAPVALWIGDPMRLSRRLLFLIFLRTLLHISGITMMFSALLYLPLAEAVAIAFVMPFIMLVLGWAVLGEEVGIRRILACIVGFIGTLLVVQPTFADVGWPAILPLGVAVVFALFMLVTRLMAKDVGPVAMQAVSGGMALPLLFAAYAVAPGLPAFEIVAPVGVDWVLLLVLGILGSAAHLVMTWSLRFAPSATLAPMQYLEIPIATIVGFVVFGDFPNGLALLGIGVTIAAGLYILARERAVSRQGQAREATHPAPPAAE